MIKKLAILSGHRSHPKEFSREDELNLLYCKELQSIIYGYADKYVSYIVPSFSEFTLNEAIMKEVYHANDNLADILISIHCNWASNKLANGFNIFYNQIETAKDKELAKKSKRLAELLASHLINDGLSFWGKEAIAEDHMTAAGNLAVCSYSKMPAILIELGFLSNEKDAKELEDPLIRKKICQCLMKGIISFYA